MIVLKSLIFEFLFFSSSLVIFASPFANPGIAFGEILSLF